MPRRNVIATLIVAAIAFPVIFIFTGAIADARARAREAPFRAVLGNARFEALMEGAGGVPHYLGASLRAPDFALPEQGGGEWKLSDHRGKVVVMNFWTVTCRPCIQEMPTIELLAEIVHAFLDDMPKQLAALRKAVAEGDSKTARRAAHTIKGSVRYFGAQEAFERAYRVESLAQDDAWAEIAAAVEELEQELASLVPKLSQLPQAK